MRLLSDDERIAAMKREYEKDGAVRSNLCYGYVVPSRGCPSHGCLSRG